MGNIKEQLTVEEVAGMLKADRRVVYDLIKAGKIKAGKVGRGWRIEADSVASFLNDAQEQSKSEEVILDATTFIKTIRLEQEASKVISEMENERKTGLASKIRPEVLSVIKAYAKEARGICVESSNESTGEAIKYYFYYPKTRREAVVVSNNDGLSFNYQIKGSRDIVDGFQQIAGLQGLTKGISFDNWDCSVLHKRMQDIIRALII